MTGDLLLHEHISALLPDDMCVHTIREVRVHEVYARLECWTQHEFVVLAGAAGVEDMSTVSAWNFMRFFSETIR